jgi:hypothetical protein
MNSMGALDPFPSLPGPSLLEAMAMASSSAHHSRAGEAPSRAGYAQNGCGKEALECSRRIKEEEETDDDDDDDDDGDDEDDDGDGDDDDGGGDGVDGASRPDAVTYTCVLKARGIVGNLEIGQAVV